MKIEQSIIDSLLLIRADERISKSDTRYFYAGSRISFRTVGDSRLMLRVNVELVAKYALSHIQTGDLWARQFAIIALHSPICGPN